jgi:hypothetical protein
MVYRMGSTERRHYSLSCCKPALPKAGNMSKFQNWLGMISAALLGAWFAAVTSHRLERFVELFPLMALVAALVEVARKADLRSAQ